LEIKILIFREVTNFYGYYISILTFAIHNYKALKKEHKQK